MSEFAVFGNPERFEIAVRWTRDSEPRSRRPIEHGWSIGDLRLTIAGRVVTKSRRGAVNRDHVAWYLSPFVRWLGENWVHLLHEEDFAWHEKTSAPAAVACRRALDSWIAAQDEGGKSQYRAVQAWYRRHALRSVSEGGLFPDLFLRRFLDEIEVSWTAGAPLFAPDGFTFVADPGFARLAVADVGVPLWEALTWAASNPPEGLNAEDRSRHAALEASVERVAALRPANFDKAYLSPAVAEMMFEAFSEAQRPDLMTDRIRPGQHFVDVFSPAVAMFGGVAPQLTHEDVGSLRALLVETAGGQDAAGLSRLVSELSDEPLGFRPYEDGYNLADDLLDALEEPGDKDFIDVLSICERLQVRVIQKALNTSAIRGVALAGDGFSPTIVVNETSVFNRNVAGRRFTVAHELCHVLCDRSRAKRVAHVSGPWVAPGIEKRANAFAAYFLMPRVLLVRLLHGANFEGDEIAETADRLQVSGRALVEHLYNMDLIDEAGRERLSSALSPH
jgi:Zn-dependent peptidase ImmA (M78 family)